MALTVFNNFMIISVVVGFLFIFATQFSRFRFDKPIVFLNLFVLSFTLYNFQRCLITNNVITVNYFVESLPFSFYGLIVPFFYTFTVHYLGIQHKVTSFLKFSVVGFLVQTAVRFALYPTFFDVDQAEVVAQYAQYEEIVNAFFAVFLFSKTVYLVFFRQDLYQELLSFDSAKWIKTFLLIGALVLATWILAIAFNINNVITPSIPLYYPLRLSTFLLLCWLGYHGFYNYALLTERRVLRIDIASETATEKSENTTLKSIKTAIHFDANFVILDTYINKNKLYLKFSLSIEEVSEATGFSIRKITDLTLKNTHLNFTDYINRFRIENAKKLLKNPKFAKYTNLAVGYECGFNSKSTFYRAFSKFTSTTPTLFKK